jgi:hypothetical protein
MNNKYIDKILKYTALLLGVPFSKFLEHHFAHTLLYTHRSYNVRGGEFIPCTHYECVGIRSFPLFENKM